MMIEMTAESVTEIDDDITLADGKRTLTNSQLLILGFIASYGAAGCSESKRDIAETLQVSLKTVDRAILRLRKESLHHLGGPLCGKRHAPEQHLPRAHAGGEGRAAARDRGLGSSPCGWDVLRRSSE